jgi:hypothetical protein
MTLNTIVVCRVRGCCDCFAGGAFDYFSLSAIVLVIRLKIISSCVRESIHFGTQLNMSREWRGNEQLLSEDVLWVFTGKTSEISRLLIRVGARHGIVST